MALTYTPAGEIGSPCPNFKLPGVDGKTYSLADFAESPALVIMFICNHCPYVKAVEDRILDLAHSFPTARVQCVAICSNDSTDYPEDSPSELGRRWREKRYGFPYLIDEDQSVARAFQAVCTPDFFLYNNRRELVYRGRLDDSWKDPKRVSRQELRSAIESTLAGSKTIEDQHPSMGCSIKWKSPGA